MNLLKLKKPVYRHPIADLLSSGDIGNILSEEAADAIVGKILNKQFKNKKEK